MRTSSIPRMKDGVKKHPSELKVGSDLALQGLGSDLAERGEKSTCTEAVEWELDFLSMKRLSLRSRANSPSLLLVGSPIIQ